MSATPAVTVLTATFDGERFVAETIDSVLAQTCSDFEYIVVDDASRDGTAALLAAYAAREPRLRVVRNAANLGPARALNAGLAAARGGYLAILDHDDLALPDRLTLQRAFLDAAPAVVAVGGQAERINAAGQTCDGPPAYPLDLRAARWRLMFKTVLLHSASMYRISALRAVGGYSAAHPSLCDYELLARLVEIGELANLPRTLACYRRCEGQYSATHRREQLGQMLLLQFALQERWLGTRIDLADWAVLCLWLHGRPPPDEAAARRAAAHLIDMLGRYLMRWPDTAGEVQNDCAAKLRSLAAHAEGRWPGLATELRETAAAQLSRRQ